MIKMKTIIVFMLSILIYPPSITHDGADVKNKIFCRISGARWISPIELNIGQLPKRCDIIDIAWYEFDREGGVVEEDKCLMSSLVKAGKTVYTHIGFFNTLNWTSIFDPLNEAEFKNQILDPLVNFIKKINIKGIIIDIEDLYTVKSCDLAQKISDFVCKIKENVDKLRVGISFIGNNYKNFIKDDEFDFKKTNKVMDYYIIDMTELNDCVPCLTKTNVSPLTSTNPDIITIEQVTSYVTNSRMDKSKILVMLETNPVNPSAFLPKGYPMSYSTYFRGAFVKKFYNGMVLDSLDSDDYEGTCECVLFPETNIAIDGWEGRPFKDCPALN